MSDKENIEVEEIEEESTKSKVDIDLPDEGPEEVEEVSLEDIEKDIKALDEGEISLFNEEKMSVLLNHLISQDKYLGEYNPTITVDLVDTMIADIKSTDEIPDDGIVAVSYTEEELKELSLRLLRYIQATQHKRTNLPLKEIRENYVQLQDERLILTKEENHLLSYVSSAMALLNHAPTKDSMKTGTWSNVLEHNDRRIGTALVVNHKDPIKQIRSKLNLMNEAAAQLIHSGLVVKMASAGSLDQALLNDNLVAAKIENSLTTYGTGLDSTSIYINEILVEHAYRQIVESNLGGISKETFEENLSILDLETLYNALAISMYPTGFKLHRQCIDNDCNNIDELTINPRRCIIYRTDRLSGQNKQHLLRGLSKTDISTVIDYRENLNPDVTKYAHILDDTYIKFKIPTFAEYKRISKSWISYLGSKSTELLQGSKDEEFRRRYIQQAMQKASIMMYSHWVEGIYEKNEDGDYSPSLVRLGSSKGITNSQISTADEDLDNFLADLSLNPEIHDKIVSSVTEFIKDSNMVVLAMAKTQCSKCGNQHTPEGEETSDELISYNAGELFFTLLHQKIARQ